MEGIKTLMTNEVKNLNEKNYYQIFSEIADELICNYYIDCGSKMYRLAEIEFYYYHYDKDNKVRLSEEWNEKTYPRTVKEAGTLFFHYSGVDICFPSSIPDGTFGGVLIRSLLDVETGLYVTGPQLCVMEMLNACAITGEWPKIILADRMKCKIGTINRYGIKYNDTGFEDKLCFYDENMICKNQFDGATWDYEKKKPKPITRYYSKRFAK